MHIDQGRFCRPFFYSKGNNMKFSDNGIQLLKQCEGCVKNGNRHVIYEDKTGRTVDTNGALPRGATIGYGHLIKPNEDFRNGITENAATEILRKDIATAEQAVQAKAAVRIATKAPETSKNLYQETKGKRSICNWGCQ